MPGQEEYEQQIKLLQAYRNRLVALLEQQAQMGSHTPAHVRIDIREAREQISRIKAIIREWGFQVADNPIDEQSVQPITQGYSVRKLESHPQAFSEKPQLPTQTQSKASQPVSQKKVFYSWQFYLNLLLTSILVFLVSQVWDLNLWILILVSFVIYAILAVLIVIVFELYIRR